MDKLMCLNCGDASIIRYNDGSTCIACNACDFYNEEPNVSLRSDGEFLSMNPVVPEYFAKVMACYLLGVEVEIPPCREFRQLEKTND